MGLFKKIFKGIGKVFKKVGKFIKKGFRKFGKFVNKLGIFGQIGMMFIMPGLANMAMKGLTTLGSGFMTGLSAAAQAGSGIAKVTHAVLTTAANTARTVISGVRTITDTVTGVVTDSARGLAKAIPGLKDTAFANIPVIDPKTGLATAGQEGTVGSIFKNTAARLESGGRRTWGHLTDVGRATKDVFTGQYDPVFKAVDPQTGVAIGEPIEDIKGFEGDLSEVKYRTEVERQKQIEYDKSLLGKKTPSEDVTLTKTDSEDSIISAWSPQKDFIEGIPDISQVGEQALLQQGMKLAAEHEERRSGTWGIPPGSTEQIAFVTDMTGRGVPLTETGFDARSVHPDSEDFAQNLGTNPNYLTPFETIPSLHEETEDPVGFRLRFPQGSYA